MKKKKNNAPKYNIDIYEKRTKYTREQFIVSGGTKGNLLFNYPHDLREILKDNFACYIDNPVLDTQGFCFRKSKNSYNINNNFGSEFENFSQTIEIKKLEKILSDYIKKNYKNKINIIHKDFTKKDIEKYDIIVGADGQNSYVREKLMLSKWENLKNYKTYILHIKYTDLSNKKYKIDSNLFPKNLKKFFNLKFKKNNYDEYDIKDGLDKKQKFDQDRFRLIRSNTNKTQFLLQIKKSTYDKIKNIKTFGKLPKKLQDVVLIDSFIMGSIPTNLKNTPINVYDTKVGHSDKYAMVKNKKLFILVGDSAMTTHVFTGEGLNVNFNLVKDTIYAYIINTPINVYDTKVGHSDKYAKVKNKNTDNVKNNIMKVIKRYNFFTDRRFDSNIKYKSLLRYIPHKSLRNICSKIKLKDIMELLEMELQLFQYEEIIKKMKKKYKHLSDNQIKNELCFIFRDKILKYYTYKLNK